MTQDQVISIIGFCHRKIFLLILRYREPPKSPSPFSLSSTASSVAGISSTKSRNAMCTASSLQIYISGNLSRTLDIALLMIAAIAPSKAHCMNNGASQNALSKELQARTCVTIATQPAHWEVPISNDDFAQT